MPPLARLAEIAAVATATGVSARSSATRFGLRVATTDAAEVLALRDVDAVVIATRHDTHAEYTVAALGPASTSSSRSRSRSTRRELAARRGAAADAPGVLMVGFNRRFAPLAVG